MLDVRHVVPLVRRDRIRPVANDEIERRIGQVAHERQRVSPVDFSDGGFQIAHDDVVAQPSRRGKPFAAFQPMIRECLKEKSGIRWNGSQPVSRGNYLDPFALRSINPVTDCAIESDELSLILSRNQI